MNKRHQNHLFLTLDSLVSPNHPYRKLDELLPMNQLMAPYGDLYSHLGRKENGVEFGFRALLLQL